MTESDEAPGVRLHRDGAVRRITLDRPERHNSLRVADAGALRAMLDDVDEDQGARVLVLTGEGDSTFSSGASLPEMESGAMSGELFDTLTDKLAHMRVPTVARLGGDVYGGGAELALCCDLRIGVAGIRLLVPAARLGVCYPVGGLSRYVQRLGLQAAARILLAAEELGSDELLRIGFLTQAVEREALDPTVDALVARLARLAPLAVQGMKRIMLDVAAGGVDEELAASLVDRAKRSRDLREGLAAWREGRDPDFEGR